MRKIRIAVFVSGGGTNLQALLDAQQAGKLPSGEIALVVASRSDAYALTRAADRGIPSEVVRRKNFEDQATYEDALTSLMRENKIDLIALGSQAAFEAAISQALSDHGVELLVLAGFMSILSKAFTDRFPQRMINIHPSLIPSFCGKGFYGIHVHEAALRYGVKVSGATVHFVNEIPDGGQIIRQKAVPVLPGDTPESLQKRVMEEAEWIILPEATEEIAARLLAEA